MIPSLAYAAITPADGFGKMILASLIILAVWGALGHNPRRQRRKDRTDHDDNHNHDNHDDTVGQMPNANEEPGGLGNAVSSGVNTQCSPQDVRFTDHKNDCLVCDKRRLCIEGERLHNIAVDARISILRKEK